MQSRGILILLLILVSGFTQAQTILHPTGTGVAGIGDCPTATCSGLYLDNGGASMNYSNNIDNSITICADQPNHCVRLEFTQFNINDVDAACGGCCDVMSIFDGPRPFANSRYSGCNTSPGTITSTDGCLTINFVSDGTVNFGGWQANVTCVPCAPGRGQSEGNNNDCSNATRICGNLLTSDISNGPGVELEGCGGSSCLTGEIYSNWYKMVAQTNGTIEFTIRPNQPGQDFDFQVFGPNPDCNNLGNPIRCSFAAPSVTGNTGVGNGAVDLSEGASGDGFVRRIDAVAGETYLLMVNKWSPIANVNNSFTITYSGTAVLAPPNAAITPTDAVICSGDSVTLSVNPPENYIWTSVPPGFNATGSEVRVAPSATTEYKVSLAACPSSRDSVIVVVAGGTLNAPTVINGPAQVCLPSGNITYTINRVAGAEGYLWSVNGAGTLVSQPSDTAVVINWTGNGSVCVQSVNDCDTSISRCLSVVVISDPVLPVAVNKSICEPAVDTFRVNGCSGTVNWFASAVSAPVLFSGNPYVVNVPFTTTYYATCSIGSCESDRVPVTVTVNNTTCDDGCPLTSDVFDPVTCECTHIPPPCDDGCPLTTDAFDPVACDCIFTPPNPDDGCPQTTDVWDAANCQVINTPPDCDDGCELTTDTWDAAACACLHTPVNAMSVSTTGTCTGREVVLSVNGPDYNSAVYTWQVSGIGTIIGYGPHTISWENTGLQTVALNITRGSCSLDYSTQISVTEILVTTSGDTLVQNGVPFDLVAEEQSSGTAIVRWYDSDGRLLCTGLTCTVTPTAVSQSYTVIATDENDCSDTARVTVTTEPPTFAYVPTAFTPNGDGINDRLLVLGEKVATAPMKIFNRWGEKVYDGDAKLQGWDGNFRGQPSTVDVYSYVVDVQFTSGERTLLKGVVALLR
jgi:gliding motility-associated-like protein